MPIFVSNEQSSSVEKVHIKANVYKAQLEALKVIDVNDKQNPGQKIKKLVWSFGILGGRTMPIIDAMTNLDASLGNEKSYNRKHYMALTGSEPPVDGDSDLEELIGLKCNVRVADFTNSQKKTFSVIADLWALNTEEPAEEAF